MKTLRPVHPNAGIRASYRRKLEALIEEMAASYERWIMAQYRETPPRLAQDAKNWAREVSYEVVVGYRDDPGFVSSDPRFHIEPSRYPIIEHRIKWIAQDATPAKELERELNRLGSRWRQRYAKMAPKLAKRFAQSASKRSERVLHKILRDGGISVKFQMTQGMRDVAEATVAENVALIKSIAEKYHTDVHGLVMRSVTSGRKLDELSRELQKRYKVTKARAALISRDQNNKATAVFTRVRQAEAGITQAIWLHSHGGREPRPTHLANTGKPYDISKGWYDPDPKVKRRIFPGELINCRCVSKPIVKGFS